MTEKKKLTMTPPSERAAARAGEVRGSDSVHQVSSKAVREAMALQQGSARLTIDMPVGAHREIKKRAADRGVSMRDWIMEALKLQGLTWS